MVDESRFAFGRAVHRAFEAFARARLAAREPAVPAAGYDLLWTTFTETIDASGCTAEDAWRWRTRGGPVLAAFLRHELASDATPVGAELGFGIDLDLPGDDTGMRFVGYIDRINRRADGSLEVIDYKTGYVRSQADVDRDVQLTAYAFALAMGGLRDPATGEILPQAERLGLYFADPGVVVWTTRSAADLDPFRARLEADVRLIRNRVFPARPAERTCRWCDYRAVCPDAPWV